MAEHLVVQGGRLLGFLVMLSVEAALHGVLLPLAVVSLE